MSQAAQHILLHFQSMPIVIAGLVIGAAAGYISAPERDDFPVRLEPAHYPDPFIA